MTHVRSSVVVCLLAVLVSGCASGEPTKGSADPPPTSPTTVTPGSPVDLPLDAYSGTGQVEVLLRAQELLLRDCMQAKGFRYEITNAPMTRATGKNLVRRPYGLTDRAQAAEFGYHDPRAIAARSRPTPTTEPPSDAYMMALHGYTVDKPGTTAGGCMKQAIDRLSSDLDETTATLVGRLTEEARSRTDDDPRVDDAVTAWSRCMAGRGFRYGSPTDAESAAWPEKPDAKEKATAVADVECKEETDLARIWSAVEAAYQHRAIEQNAEALQHVRALLARRAARAADIVAEDTET